MLQPQQAELPHQGLTGHSIRGSAPRRRWGTQMSNQETKNHVSKSWGDGRHDGELAWVSTACVHWDITDGGADLSRPGAR